MHDHSFASDRVSDKNYMRAANSEVSIYFLSLGPKELDLMMSSEVIQKFPSRHPASSPEARDSIEDVIREQPLKGEVYSLRGGDNHGASYIFFRLVHFLSL